MAEDKQKAFADMIQNIASGRNLEKNGFCLEEKEVEEELRWQRARKNKRKTTRS